MFFPFVLRSDIKVVHVLSEETREDCESGFITAELISRYLPANGTCSIFMCGPEAMYKFVGKEVEKLLKRLGNIASRREQMCYYKTTLGVNLLQFIG